MAKVKKKYLQVVFYENFLLDKEKARIKALYLLLLQEQQLIKCPQEVWKK